MVQVIQQIGLKNQKAL